MKGRGEISDGRRSIRVKGFDYSQDGAYYVTICTHRRECTLGSVKGNAVQLTELGRAAEESWQDLPVRYPHLTLDALVVMPNHVHVILVIDGTECRGGGATPPLQSDPTLGQIVGYTKYQSTKRINERRGTPGERVWQRNYYEHIIRNDADLRRIREYIASNPLGWSEDPENPNSQSQT